MKVDQTITVIDKLKKRFKPVDIEKLGCIEFHQKMQSSAYGESVEKLGLCLAGKAFPKFNWERIWRNYVSNLKVRHSSFDPSTCKIQ